MGLQRLVPRRRAPQGSVAGVVGRSKAPWEITRRIGERFNSGKITRSGARIGGVPLPGRSDGDLANSGPYTCVRHGPARHHPPRCGRDLVHPRIDLDIMVQNVARELRLEHGLR
jgi:hypothetical protein